MPNDTHDNLIRRHGYGAQSKSAVVKEYLSHHPYPRWDQIVRLLEDRERAGKARAGLTQEVKDKYMTSEYAILELHNYRFVINLGIYRLALHSVSLPSF